MLQREEGPVTGKTLASLDHGTERLVLRLTEHRGRKQMDLRIFDPGGFPTKSGFSVEPEKLLELRAAIDTAIQEAQAEGLLPSTTAHKRKQA